MAKKRTQQSKKKLGQIPGSVIYTGNRAKSKLFIEAFDYNKESYLEKELNSIEEAFSFGMEDTITWININGLNHVQAIESLGNHYELHPLVLEDIVNVSQRPKSDEYDDYLFLVVKMLYYVTLCHP